MLSMSGSATRPSLREGSSITCTSGQLKRDSRVILFTVRETKGGAVMENVQLRVGDQLLQRGLVTHVMTYVGAIGPYGEDVLDAPKGGAARLVHFAEIAERGEILLGERGPESWLEQRTVQQRAIAAIGTVNRTGGPNCEHISSFIRKGKPESPQLAFGVFATLIALIIVLSA